MRPRPLSTLLVALAGACESEPEPTNVEPPVERWQVEPEGRADHVVIGPGATIHAADGFAEVARLPADAGMLGLRVLELGYWIVVTPSWESCTTPWVFRDVDLRFAIRVDSLIPVAKSTFSTHFPDGTSVSVARGAPMRRLDASRFQLVAGGVGVPLSFDVDPTTYFHAPDSVAFNRKPHDGYAWDWTGEFELELGPTELRGEGRPSTPYFELVDQSRRRVELNGRCAGFSAKIAGDAPLPPRDPHPLTLPPEPGRSRLEPGTPLIWPTGEVAGQVRASIDVRRAEGTPEGLRCYELEPFVLCVDP